MRVFNTHSSQKPGEHWIAVACRGDGNVSYFDSFGRHPCFYPDVHAALLSRFSEERILWNDVTVQHPLTNTCGDYCVLFGAMWSRGWSLSRYTRQLVRIDGEHKRDHFVRELVIERFGELPASTDGEGKDLVHVQGTGLIKFLVDSLSE